MDVNEPLLLDLRKKEKQLQLCRRRDIPQLSLMDIKHAAEETHGLRN